MAALFIQPEGGAGPWEVWPRQEPIPPGQITESTSYVFELRDCEEAAGADLLIDDQPLEGLRSRQPHASRWRWEPGFHAGVVDATLKIPGSSPRLFSITTDPDQRKLTRADFDVMVREILEDTFALFSLSAFRRGIARQSGTKPPPLARLEFLRSRAQEIVDTVAAITRAPRHFLRAEDVTVPAHRAARATGPEILKSFRGGAIRAETATPSRLPAPLRGRLPARITLRARRNSADIPEHRQIKGCLLSWSAWLTGVADILARPDPQAESETTTTAAAWAARTRVVARRLRDVVSDCFWPQVGKAPAQLRMSSLFRRDPVYRRFFGLWQDMNLGLAGLFGEFLNMPLARTFELYELWCFLRLVRAGAEEYGSEGLDVSGLFHSDASGGVTLAAGPIIVPLPGGQTLCFQRQYREYWIEPDGHGSFSRTMIPDVVFAGKGPVGVAARELIVLDAKYRIDDGLNEALNSIHTYRDALVRETGTGKIEGIVTAAYLLTPYLAELEPDYRKTALPGRLFHPEYRRTFRFGAVMMRPGMTAHELRLCLRTIVSDAGTI